MSDRKFDVFLSYSRAADGLLAPRLQDALGKIARPWYRRRSLRVFRDATTLSATPELWPSIQRALDQSHYFVLLASPQAKESEWVTQELTYWLAQNRPAEQAPSARLLIVLTNGHVVWDRKAGVGG